MSAARGDRALGAASTEHIPRLVLDVWPRPEELASARHAVVSFLQNSDVPSTVVDDMELVTSELVTNAMVHGRVSGDGAIDPIRIEVEVHELVTIAVANFGSAEQIPDVSSWRPAAPSALSGRGLGIVRRLCDDVTVTQDDEWAMVLCQRRLPDGRGSR